jgi:hypothetical protein
MGKLGAILVTAVSIPFVTLGLIFLLASGTDGRYLLYALVVGAIGVVLLVAGLRRLRRLAEIRPDTLRTGAVEMARRLGGELTVAELRAEYRIPQELATKVMEQLAGEGTCVREQREERVVYVFKGLLPSLAKKSCPYCGTELPLREALRKCPNCGAQLEITKT